MNDTVEIKKDKVVVKVFSSATCTNCKPYKDNLKKAGVEYEEYTLEEHREELMKYGIRGVPTTVIEDEEGNLLRKIVGNQPASEVTKFL